MNDSLRRLGLRNARSAHFLPVQDAERYPRPVVTGTSNIATLSAQ